MVCQRGKAKKVFVKMANLILVIAALSFLVSGCLSHPGGATRNKCPPKPPTIQEFNATEYLGIWYEQHLDPDMLEHATQVLVDNGIDITPLEDTVQNEECVYDQNV